MVRIQNEREAPDFKSKYIELQMAVKDLYLSAYWRADREVDDKFLWEEVRDKADIPSNLSSSYLGEERETKTEKDLEKALAIIYILTENEVIQEHLPMTTDILNHFLKGFQD